ncbi:MAG: trigger factor [Clostridiales bacterium]|jgi:trigger factor|nr:trigger factor [Clostridiales bacterium]
MSFALRKKEGNTATFEVVISAKEFADARTRAYNKKVSKISIPGFRKGKAPKSIIEKYYGEDIFFDDAINLVFPSIYEGAVKELELEPVDRPNAEVEDASSAEGVVLKVEVTCKPEVNLGKYKGIEIPEIDYTLTDDDIDAELQFMQQRNGRIISADDKVVAVDDIAVIDFKGYIDGKAFEGGSAENYQLEIGSGSFIPGFEEQIKGHKKGDDFDVSVTFPKDYNAAEYAGKPAVFKVSIKEVKQRELPALDDEFAKDVSEFDTLDELKKSIRTTKSKENERKQRSETEDSIIDAIIEDMEVDIPEVMVKEELVRIAQNMDNNMRQQGMSLEQYFQMADLTAEGFAEEFREKALNQVKANLAIEEIAGLENFTASEDEIDQQYQKSLKGQPQTKIDEIKAIIPAETIARNIRVTKVLDFLINSAIIKK